MEFLPLTEQGERGGTTHVFVHGSPGGRDDWRPVLERAGGAHVVLVDLPDRVADDAAEGLETLRTALEKTVGSLGAKRLRLVGHGLGAYLCARALPSLGSQVDRAVLVAGYASIPHEAARIHEEWLEQLDAGTLGVGELSGAVLGMMVGSEVQTEGVEEPIRLQLESLDAAQWRRVLQRTIAQADPGHAVTAYETPATVVHGRRDALVPMAAGEELASLGRRSELSILDTDAHALPLTHPDEVARPVFG
jgi:pimeloyl-ACP methyl ester carboxylesterase